MPIQWAEAGQGKTNSSKEVFMELSSVSTPAMQSPTPDSGGNNAEMMKGIRKARLQRQVLADPSLAAKLVSVQASATYNANGSVVQTVGGSLGEV